MIRTAFEEFKPKPLDNFSSSIMNGTYLADTNGDIYAPKAADIEFKRIREIADDISAQAIRTINNRQYWSESDRQHDPRAHGSSLAIKTNSLQESVSNHSSVLDCLSSDLKEILDMIRYQSNTVNKTMNNQMLEYGRLTAAVLAQLKRRI